MPLRLDQFDAQLAQARELAPAWLIAGNEHLLVIEASDRLRRRARELGYDEREVLDVESGFDWNDLARAGAAMSLFARRRLLDLRLPTGKPGREGSEAIQAYLESPPPDTVLMITANDWSTKHEGAWSQAIDRAGVFVPVWPLKPHELPAFLSRRAAAAGLDLSADAITQLVVRTEGNLLAAAQEIDKLVLLADGQRIDGERLEALVADHARYDVFVLTDALLAGDGPRALRIAGGLKAEGDAVPALISWVATTVSQVARVAAAVDAGTAADAALRGEGVWSSKLSLFKSALARGNAAFWQARVTQLAEVEKAGKGRADGDPWVLFERFLAACTVARRGKAR
jgi:DNA polymerase-3 subunit delta